MKTECKKLLLVSILFIAAFALWTLLILTVDVKQVGVNSTNVGFASLNTGFYSLTGVNMLLYNITDWLGLVPLTVCMSFCALGLIQLIKRKSLFKVDADILLLGVYYVIVLLCYFLFETVPVNYRPILINGFMEASYPSSTTLLVLSVMPTLAFQLNYRVQNKRVRRIAGIINILFCSFTVAGRLISGVHWLTDIMGSVFLSVGLFYAYKAACSLLFLTNKEK